MRYVRCFGFLFSILLSVPLLAQKVRYFAVFERFSSVNHKKTDISTLENMCFEPLSESAQESFSKEIKHFFVNCIKDSLSVGSDIQNEKLISGLLDSSNIIELFEIILPVNDISGVDELLQNNNFRREVLMRINIRSDLSSLIGIFTAANVKGYDKIDPDEIGPDEWIFLKTEMGNELLKKIGLDFPACECLSLIRDTEKELPACADFLDLNQRPDEKKMKQLVTRYHCETAEAKVDLSTWLLVFMAALVMGIMWLFIRRLTEIERKFDYLQRSNWNNHSSDDTAGYKRLSEKVNQIETEINKLKTELQEVISRTDNIKADILSSISSQSQVQKDSQTKPYSSDSVRILFSDSIDLLLSGRDLTSNKDGLYKFTEKGNTVEFTIQTVSERHFRNPFVYFSDEYVDGISHIMIGDNFGKITPGLFEKQPGGTYILRRKMLVR
jgi:hypothetical protein